MPLPSLLRRLEAFTILELLVVMVVSALLFGMAYSALHTVQRQQQIIERKSALLGQISTWQTVLAADFYASTTVKVAGDQVHCQRRDVEVIYTFQDSTLVREQGELADTFRLPIRQYQYFWQGQERTSGLIDELALLGVAVQDTFYLQAQRSYPAQELVPPLASPYSPVIP